MKSVRRRRAKKRARGGVLLILLAVAALAATFATPMFEIEEIKVLGSEKLSEEEIRLASGIISGANIFRVSTKRAAEQIEKIPYVKAVSISRRLPATILINVTERQPAAYLRVLDGVITIDAQGVVLENTPGLDKPECPFVTGAKAVEFNPGEKIKVDESEKFDIMLLYAKHLKNSGLKVSEINLERPEEVYVTLGSGLKVNMGSTSEIEYKIKNLVKIIGELGEQTDGYLDLRNPDKASYRKNP